MNEFPPIASPTNETPRSGAVSLPALASARRWVWVGVLAHVTSLFAGVASQNLSMTASPAPGATYAFFLVLQGASAAVCAFVVGKLTLALRMKWGWVAVVLSLFSLVGLLALVSISRLATAKLRAANYRIASFKTFAP